jgi:predicted DNA-binding transcriptional regulator YafY
MAVRSGDDVATIADHNIGVEAFFQLLERVALQRPLHARSSTAVEEVDICPPMPPGLAKGEQGIDCLNRNRTALHAGLGVLGNHRNISLIDDDSLVGLGGDKNCHGGCWMSFGKAVDLLRLAMLATTRRGICLTDIESEFACVRRTAQRMVVALEEAFPATERFIADDSRAYWRLPARAVAHLLSPTADELAALSAAELELNRAGLGPEAGQLRTLASKVRALIPGEHVSRLETDEEAVLEAMGFAARPGPRATQNPDVDAAIGHALKGPCRLRICYRSRADDEASWRTVEPLGLLLGSRRYLVAIDTAKRDGNIRHFRVESMVAAEVLSESFGWPDDFNLKDYADRAFGSYYDANEHGEVVWKFAPHAAERAAGYQFHPEQSSKTLDDGSLVVRFAASGHVEMCWHLYAWGDAVEVISPPALAEMVHPWRRHDFPSLP